MNRNQKVKLMHLKISNAFDQFRLCAANFKGKNPESEHERIYHYHIRKTGGSSVNQMFLSLGGGDGRKKFREIHESQTHRIVIGPHEILGWDKKGIQEGKYFFAFSHIPFEDLNLPPGTFRFTVVRDPLARLFSYFKMLKEYDCTGIWSEIGRPHFDLSQEVLTLGQSIPEFLALTARNHILNQIWMFSKVLDIEEAIGRVSTLDAVYETGNFFALSDDFERIFAIDLPFLHANESASAPSLSSEEIDILHKALRLEYEFIERVRNLPNFRRTS